MHAQPHLHFNRRGFCLFPYWQRRIETKHWKLEEAFLPPHLWHIVAGCGHSSMRLVILEDYDKTSEWAAKYVRNTILKFNPGPDNYFVLGLPTGN